jgi:NDP-sugar pyrophosphorylase family protein
MRLKLKKGKLVILAGGISSRMKKHLDKINLDEKLISDADEKSKSMIGVGKGYRPFLDYLLYNAREAGYDDIVIVIGQDDNSIKQYYGKETKSNQFKDLSISYAVQLIPDGRNKPLGTADALLYGLRSKHEWKGSKFSVCNSDNLYSIKALTIMLNSNYDNALIDYDRSAFEFDLSRIEKFAVTIKDDRGFLTDIIEKPGPEEIEKAKDKNGFIGVSMNLFSLSYDQIFPILEKVPLHPVRQEKELPEAVKKLVNKNKSGVYTFRLSEHVPDLTDKNDIPQVKKYLEKYSDSYNF